MKKRVKKISLSEFLDEPKTKIKEKKLSSYELLKQQCKCSCNRTIIDDSELKKN